MDRKKEYEKRKAQRIKRRSEGVCTRCGVPLDDMTHVQCKRCRDTFRLVYYPMSTLAGKRRAMCDRGRNGDCWQCGKPLPQGYQMKDCPECIEKKRQGVIDYYRRKRLENLHKRSDNEQPEL